MRILHINSVPYGSTGNIMFSLADYMKANGHTAYATAGFTFTDCKRNDFFITSGIFEKFFHKQMAYLTGKAGFYSVGATKRLLRFIDLFSPDVIHLHNLHCWFVNVPLLFSYIKEKEIPVVWTLHDAWPFTGHCAHFDGVSCEGWKIGCGNCPQTGEYPASLIDVSKEMYVRKKELFSGIKNMNVVTPSNWLCERVKESFLSDYPVTVINNSVDTDTFKPKTSDFRARYGIGAKWMILGVSDGWSQKKGLDVFIELARRFDDRYAIVLVGTDKNTEKTLPGNIISIRKTADRDTLAEIYSAADVFVNPTKEDTFPTVNIEALASGTPIVTFNSGGSPEIIDENCGISVDKNDVDALEAAITQVLRDRPFSSDNCVIRAKTFSKDKFFKSYVRLYEIAAESRYDRAPKERT